MNTYTQPAIPPRLRWILAGVLFVISWGIFANTLSHGYVWDDAIAITQNPRTQQGLDGVAEHFQFRSRYELADFNGYRPIALTTFSLDIELFGNSPEAAHRMQVLYFSLLVLAIFFTLQRLFPEAHPFYPFMAALLFAVHPLHVEVVANLKSRDEMLGLLFGVLALNFFIRFVREQKWWALPVSFALLVLGILSKENTITYLGVFVVVAWVVGSNLKNRLIGVASVVGIVVLVLGVFQVLTGRAPGASPDETTPAFIENMVVNNSHATNMSFVERLVNSGHLFLLYLRNFLWPTELVYHSGFNHIPVLSAGNPIGLLGALLMLGLPLFMGVMALLHRWRDLVLGFFLFFIPLTIYLQVALLVPDTMADRFMFAPSLGLAWMVVMLVRRLAKGRIGAMPWGDGVVKGNKLNLGGMERNWMIGGGALVLLAGFWAVLTVQRNPVWADNLSLFNADIEVLEADGKAHYYLATELMVRYGQDPMRGKEQAEAIEHYYTAIEKSPFLFYARLELGDHLVNVGRVQEGVQVLDAARKKFPEHADPQFYFGKAAFMAEDYPGAVDGFSKALALVPDDPDIPVLLAQSYGRSGEFETGVRLVDSLIRVQPRNLTFRDARSDIYFERGQSVRDSILLRRSFQEMEQMLEIEPNNEYFWKKMIGRYQLLGDNENAGIWYQKALQKGVLSPQ